MSIPEDVTISIGVVFTDGTEKDYTELFAKADEALYESKMQESRVTANMASSLTAGRHQRQYLLLHAQEM